MQVLKGKGFEKPTRRQAIQRSKQWVKQDHVEILKER